METDQWLSGWREIGKYIGKSAKTAQRYGRDGMNETRRYIFNYVT
jgi:hypothetical protein